MQVWHGIVIGLVVGGVSYYSGYNNGLRDCPENTRYIKAERERVDRELEEMFSEPIGRELVCDKIFDLVTDELHQEVIDEQEALSRAPSRD